MTLRNKIVISVVLVILLLGISATYVVFSVTRNKLIDNEKQSFELITKKLSNELDQIFIQSGELVEKIASQPEVFEVLSETSTESKEKSLALLKKYNIADKYSSIYIMDKSGTTLVSTDPRFIGKNYSFRKYFQQAITGYPYVDVVRGVTSGEIGYYFSYPLVSNNRDVVGVIVMKMRPEYIHQYTELESTFADRHIVLTDSYGIIIHSDQEKNILKSLGTLTDHQQEKIMDGRRFEGIDIKALSFDSIQYAITQGEQNSYFELYDPINQQKELFALAKIGDYPFYIVVDENIDIITSGAVTSSLILSLLVLLSSFIAGLVVYLLITFLLKPLRNLSNVANQVARGNLKVKMNVNKGSTDLKKLAVSFNNMIIKVRQSKQQVEKKVKEQTKKIMQREKELSDQNDAMLNILEDVEEEKKKAESYANDLKKFQLAVDYASDHIVITDPDGIILYANKAVEKITGYTINEVMGKKAGDKEMWGGQMSPELYKKMWKTIKKDKKIFSGLIDNVRKGGEKYIALASISPVLNKNNEVQFFVGIERDVTKEKQIDQAKTEFVSLASHQLRTPLSAINWYAEMILAGDVGKLNKELKEYLEEIYDSNHRMIDLVNSLLNVSRIELGTFAIDPEKVKLKEIIDDVVKELQPRIKNKKLKYQQKIGAKVPKLYNGDKKLLNIIFQNLLSNAVKYTPEKGKIKLDLSVRNKMLRLVVADNGFGIPIKDQEHIFQKLFRADNIREKDTDGTGLGLYIIKAIVEQSKGKIWFESKENKGTKFYVELPLKGMKKKQGSKPLS